LNIEFDNSADAFFWVNQDGYFIHINHTACQLLGYSHNELLALGVKDLDNRLSGEKWVNHWQAVKEKKTHIMRTIIHKKDGSSFPAQATIKHLDYNGEELHLTRLIDLTLQDQIDKNRQQSQKMQAIGTLAGGIAHDFNNILGIIMGNAELANMNLKDNKDTINNILEASRRGRDLVSQLLSFSRKKQVQKQIIHPIPLIKEALKFMRSTIPSSIEIHTQFQDESIQIYGDPTQLHQVIMNLCTNAYHAMGETSGILTIAVHSIEINSERAKQLSVNPGTFAEIKIKDTGLGMSIEVQNRIFEPFYSTKSEIKGTGLGLAVALGAVQDFSGSITVDSKPGHGSTFTINIPLSGTPLSKKGMENIISKKNVKEVMSVSYNDHELTIDLFSAISSQWIAKLHSAALAGNFKTSMEMVDQLPPEHKKLMEVLRYLIDNFQFETVIDKIGKYHKSMEAEK
jgi:PAS domain S-box-containing protein